MNVKFLRIIMLSLFVSGCANEIRDQETLNRITDELKKSSDPIEIHERKDLYNESQNGVYSNKSNERPATNKPKEPVFEAEPATGAVVNAKPFKPTRAGGKSKGTVTLNFESADLREVVKFIMTDLLNKNYIISPNVQGQVTLQTSKPVAKEDLLPTLETLLKINGAVIVQDNDLIRILPQAEANRGNLVPKVGKIKNLKPGYEVRIIPLKYLSAEDAQKTLEPFLPDGGLIQVDNVKNIITIAGSSEELANIQQTIDIFDVDWLKGMSIGLYRLQNASIEEVLPELEGLFGQGGNTPFAGLFQFIAMERMNSIMVITRQQSYLAEARRWLEKLDKTVGEDTERLYVYRVQNGRAEDLANVLGGIFESKSKNKTTKSRTKSVAAGSKGKSVSSNKSATSKTSKTARSARSVGSTISGAEAIISADDVNNSLVIKATPSNYDLVLQALRQLDVPKLQVLLDVVIAEIVLTDDLQYGFKYWLQQDSGGRNHGVSSNGVGSSNVGVATNALGDAAAAVNGFNYTMANLTGKISSQITALASRGLAQFLSTPSLMVLDNETATMKVGNKISISTGTTTSTTTNEEYLDTGVSLEITPRVNAGGLVVLDISQDVSRSVASSVAGRNPDILDRKIKSSISALDGQTVVLGGLIQEETNNDRFGVPILQDIPIAGALFRSTSKTTTRTELIVLVTPKVARNAQDSLRITKEFREKMKGLDIYNKSRGSSL